MRGTVGYATDTDAADFKTVFGKIDLPDDDYAVTKAQSAAVLAMPDSSLISLGENTSVKVGAFDSASASPGSTIVVNGGALRFDIRRPEGGVANYKFQTPTSQVAVRGTVGLLAFVNGVTTVGCVVCAADSVAVTVGSQTLTLVTGQFLADFGSRRDHDRGARRRSRCVHRRRAFRSAAPGCRRRRRSGRGRPAPQPAPSSRSPPRRSPAVPRSASR